VPDVSADETPVLEVADITMIPGAEQVTVREAKFGYAERI
jgi:hypothetical protein